MEMREGGVVKTVLEVSVCKSKNLSGASGWGEGGGIFHLHMNPCCVNSNCLLVYGFQWG